MFDITRRATRLPPYAADADTARHAMLMLIFLIFTPLLSRRRLRCLLLCFRRHAALSPFFATRHMLLPILRA